MGLVHIVDPNTKEEHQYYMDDKLQMQLKNRVLPLLNQKDEDYIVIIDGGERMGMSTLALSIIEMINWHFKS